MTGKHIHLFVALGETKLPECSEFDDIQAKNDSLEAELEATRCELSLLFENIGHAVRVIGTDYKIKRINNAFSRMSGISQEDAVGKQCWEVFPSSYCRTPQCRLNRILSGEKIIHGEIMRINKDGGRFPCHITALPLKNPNGDIISIMEIFRDMSELKRYEELIQESEERYRTLIELETEVGEAILMVQTVDGVKGKNIFVSDQWPRMTGYSKEELLNMTIFDIISPEFRDTEFARYQRKFADKETTSPFESAVIRKDGSKLPLELVIALSTYQGKPAQVAYIRDISARKSLEDEAREQRKRFQSLFENAPIAIWEMDCSPIKNYFNKLRTGGSLNLRDYFAIHQDEFDRCSCLHRIIDVNDSAVTLWDAPNKNDFFEGFWRLIPNQPQISGSAKSALLALWEGATRFAYDESICTLAGKQKHLHTEWRIAPGHEENWGLVYLCQTDVTTLWMAEQYLKQYQGRLEEMVEARTSQLEQEIELRRSAEKRSTDLYEEEGRLRRKLEKQMSERVEFTRALVHEIKTPLTPLLAASEMLTTQCTDELQKNLATHLYAGACDLNSRIDELFDFTKGEMGTLKLKRTNVNLLQLFNDILESVRPQALSKGQVLTEQIEATLPEALSDGGRLRQVTLNILNNALKFTPSGGSIVFKARSTGSELLVEVKDTGPGIAKQDQERLFQTYYRSDRGNVHFSGLGLGLAISKTLVELHGGRIWVESDEGKGSAFFFSIPLFPDAKGELKG